jgi:hypothetical protein
VTAGKQVAVFGTETSGSVTATRVAIGTPPAGGPGGPGGPKRDGAPPGRGPGGSPGGGPGGSPGGPGGPGSHPESGPRG